MTTTTHLPIGPLLAFHTAGVLGTADVHVAAALMRIGGRDLAAASAADECVALGAALCVRALRSGSVCVDLTADPLMWAPDDDAADATPTTTGDDTSATATAALPWPGAEQWLAAAGGHPLVARGTGSGDDRPLRLVGPLLYLQRYWGDEQQVRSQLEQRALARPVAEADVIDALARLFPADGPDRQRLAAACAALRGITIVAGGPGTGKTTTVARIVALLRHLEGPRLTVALAAPTGKAAARLQEAVAGAASAMAAPDRQLVGAPEAATLHRLLGWRPDSQGRFRHDRLNPLPHDVVIVDETSMVSLPMMARLLEAVRPDARLVLVGDPDQLASIEAGAVLSDLVATPREPAGATAAPLAAALARVCPHDGDQSGAAAASGVVHLDRNYRFGRAVALLADAIRQGDADAVLAVLRAGHDDVQFLDPDAAGGLPTALPPRVAEPIRAEVTAQAGAVREAAAAGDAVRALGHLEDHRVLCARRDGPYGASHWSDLIESWTTSDDTAHGGGDPFPAGRPLLVTANDYTIGLYNGDTGVIIALPEGGTRAAFARGDSYVLLPPARLDGVQTLHAMTIHRGQGSQFRSVTVVLPPVGSSLLTRELLYTAVTRARETVRLVASESAVRAAVEQPVRRASGLRLPRA